MPDHSRLLIVGGGPAGYTSALYAARAGLHPVCIEGFASGGQISRSPRIDNFPGIPGVTGADLSSAIREQAVVAGAEMVFDDVMQVTLDARPFTVTTTSKTYTADSLIIATGASARRLGLPSEDAYDGRGVAYCVTCDGPFFAGKRVVVVGGGDAAIEEALALRDIAAQVTLVHRKTTFRASVHSQQLLADATDVEVITPAIVEEIVGDDTGVTGLRLTNVEDGSTRMIDADGVFVCIGHIPASDLFTSLVRCDPMGFILTEVGSTSTNVPGVFAAGDVADRRYRQAITAAATGCQAAMDAERWLLRQPAVTPTEVLSAAS